jgi:hypothetical protein
MTRFITQYSGKLLCLVCAREMPKARARFHVLHCRDRYTQTGSIINGKRQIDSQEDLFNVQR